LLRRIRAVARSEGPRTPAGDGRPFRSVRPRPLGWSGCRPRQGRDGRRGGRGRPGSGGGPPVDPLVGTSPRDACPGMAGRGHRGAAAVGGGGEELVTPDQVLVETWLLLHHRLGRGAAERFWEGFRSGVALIEPVVPADLEVAWAAADRFPDRDFSLVDRT